MKSKIIYVCSVLYLLIGFTHAVWGSSIDGTILTGFSLTKICKDASCTSYGNVNWKPTLNANTTGATAVHITSGEITGWLWGDEIGWINLQPTDSGVSVNETTGIVTGYAYSNTGSWINFSPTTESGGTSVGVTIDSDGEFTGWAYVSGINGGWMKFDCGSASTCITTDWRPHGSSSSATTTSFTSSTIISGGVASITVAATDNNVVLNPFLSPLVVVDPTPFGYNMHGSNKSAGIIGKAPMLASGALRGEELSMAAKPINVLSKQPCDFWSSLPCQLPVKAALAICTLLIVFSFFFRFI